MHEFLWSNNFRINKNIFPACLWHQIFYLFNSGRFYFHSVLYEQMPDRFSPSWNDHNHCRVAMNQIIGLHPPDCDMSTCERPSVSVLHISRVFEMYRCCCLCSDFNFWLSFSFPSWWFQLEQILPENTFTKSLNRFIFGLISLTLNIKSGSPCLSASPTRISAKILSIILYWILIFPYCYTWRNSFIDFFLLTKRKTAPLEKTLWQSSPCIGLLFFTDNSSYFAMKYPFE